MYRHFAVVTLLLTLGVAFFADGENREAAAAEVAVHTTPQTPPPVIKRSSAAARAGTFGSDFGGGPSAPSDFGGSGNSGVIPDYLPNDAVTALALELGYPPATLAAMSEAERMQLMKSLQEAGLTDANRREEQAAMLLASSRNRSGSTGNETPF